MVEAIKSFRASIASGHDGIRVRWTLGELYLSQRQGVHAIKEMCHAARHVPATSRALARFAWARLRRRVRKSGLSSRLARLLQEHSIYGRA
jgi:hypothetical protein